MSDEKPVNPESEVKAARPNAKYKLSRQDGDEEHLTFYYSRERRLAKAPKPVQDLYAEGKRPRFSLLRPLVGSKPRAMMFFSIVLLCAAILALSVFGYFDTSYSLEGNRLSIQALRYEEAVIVALKKSIKKGASAYTGAVELAVSPVQNAGDTEQPVFYHRIFFSQETLEEYRFAVPFDSKEMLMVLQTEKNTLSLKIKPE
ncbi:hypothetical protein AGMMS50293_18930 [Spirochaetia bacterium]|nr:hypothetical protein AGMMS50293_18930 [Spirochaetia bacterium]